MAYLLPETAPVRAILLAWPFFDSDWRETLQNAETCYWNMLTCLHKSVPETEVWVLLHPSIDLALWQGQLSKFGLDNLSLKVFHDIAYDDTWVRDYGPLSMVNGYFSYTFNGWGGKYEAKNDNKVAEQLAETLEAPFVKSEFVAEGGALEINESAVLLANKDCVVDDKRNLKSIDEVEAELKSRLGVKEFIWLQNISLTGDDTDGHIDTLARFTEKDGIICCGRSADHPDKGALESLNTQLEEVCDARQWSLFRLPMPLIESDVDGRRLPATYANFLVTNNVVFVPAYGVAEDCAALEVIGKAFPNFQIAQVRCEALLEQHGSLHCATMQISKLEL